MRLADFKKRKKAEEAALEILANQIKGFKAYINFLNLKLEAVDMRFELTSGNILNNVQANALREKLLKEVNLYECHIKNTKNLQKVHRDTLELVNKTVEDGFRERSKRGPYKKKAKKEEETES